MSNEGQKNFNLKKGSVTIVNDARHRMCILIRTANAALKDLALLRAAIDGYPGSIMTPAFGDDLQDILTQFLTDGDVDSAIAEIAASSRT